LAQGQAVIRGDVVLADGATPAAGVIVEVTDSVNALVVRALTGDRGTFSVRLPRAGSYGARVLRIGFRPTLVPAFGVASGETKTLHIVLNSEPVRLAEVRVAGEDACRIRADSGKLVAQVWEETRKALASAQLSATGERLVTTALSYRSTRGITGDAVLWQSFSTLRTATARPFVSPPAASLAAIGYATPGVSGRLDYYGPDAEALISDEFAAGHCFRLLPPPRERAGWVGVAFRPVRDRRGVSDIAGTFWVDRNTAELRLLEYRYTNVPVAVERAGSGGRIEFLRLASGDWLLNRWNIRAPHMIVQRTVATEETRVRGRIAVQVPREGTLGTLALSVSGGEVLSVERDGDELYRGGAVSWDAVLASRREDAGSADATIEFPETGYFAVADSAGRVHLDHLQPGRYDALISTWATRVLDLPAVRHTIEIGATTRAVPDSLALATDDRLLADRCGKDAVARGRSVLFGTLVDDRRSPVEGDTLQVRWISDAGRAAGASQRWEDDSLRLAEGVPPRTEAVGGAVTGGFGRWFVCGVPRSATIRVSSEPAGGRAALLLQFHVGPRDRLAGVELTSVRAP
jgi:hypothetical protein